MKFDSKVRMKKFCMEDPPEYYVHGAVHVQRSIRHQLRDASPISMVDEQPVCVDGLLSSLGPAVAYEREDGSMALSTWDCASISVWAQLDVPSVPALASIRQHMIKAVPFDQPRPPGFIRVICVRREHSTEPV